MRSNRWSAIGSNRLPFADGDVGDVVQLHRQGGAGGRPRVEVGGDHTSAVGGCVEGLHAAAGAEVECAVDVAADRGARQGLRRCAHPEDVVVRERLPVPPGEVVADQPIGGATDGADRETTRHVAVVGGQHATGDPVLDGRGGQGRLRLRPRDRQTGDEQPEDRVEPIARPRRPHQRRNFTLGEVRERVDAEPFRQRVVREAGLVEALSRLTNGVGTVEETHVAHRRIPQRFDETVEEDGSRETVRETVRGEQFE